MGVKTRAALVTVAFTALAFLIQPMTPLGGALWGPMPDEGPDPTPTQLGLLVVATLVEAVAFGVGVAFLMFARRIPQSMPGPRGAAWASYAAVGWGLMSWTPHGALHATNGENLARLIVIEYTFHITLIAATLAIAWFLVGVARVSRGRQAPLERAIAGPAASGRAPSARRA